MATGLMQNLNVNLPRNLALPVGGSVNLHQVDQVAGQVVSHGTDLLLNIAMALVVVMLGWLFSRWLASSTQSALLRAHIEETLAAFLGSVARYAIFLTAIILALNLAGLNGTSLVAFFGALGLAVAFALRNTLSHVAAGVMLMVNQPFKVGDYIEVGTQAGTVKRLTLFNTEINTRFNLRVFIPNSQIWENLIVNYTYNAQRMIEVRLRASYAITGKLVCETLQAELTRQELVLPRPEPYVGLDTLGESAVEYVVRVWVRTGDVGSMTATLPEALRQALATAGAPWPLPQRLVQLIEPMPATKTATNQRKSHA